MEIQAIRVNADELTSFCKRAFKKYGFQTRMPIQLQMYF